MLQKRLDIIRSPSLLQWLLPTGASTGLDITMLDQEIQLLCEQGIAA